MNVRITLEDMELIVPHGTRTLTWLVRVRDAWVKARSVEGAEIERLDAGPGTVWRQAITLELAPDARLVRVDSTPQMQRKTPLEYLAKSPLAARRVTRREFRLGAKGELQALTPTRPGPPKPAKSGK